MYLAALGVSQKAAVTTAFSVIISITVKASKPNKNQYSNQRKKPWCFGFMTEAQELLLLLSGINSLG